VMGIVRPPADEPLVEATRQRALHVIGVGDWDTQFQDARGMGLTRAVAYAVESPPPLAHRGLERGQLTPRERQVAALIGLGLSNRDIAARLVLSVRTTEAHVTHVLGKLGLRSRAQLAVWASEQGLLSDVS
jgi:DNA-binding NarL/FixJ family response regulator